MAIRPLIPGHNNNRHLTPEELENNIEGVPITDAKLHELFESYDVHHNGYLDYSQVKKLYLEQEHYGCVPSDAEVERFMRKYCANTDKVSYDEFCAMWLALAQR